MKENIEIEIDGYLIKGIYNHKSNRIQTFKATSISGQADVISLTEDQIFRLEMKALYAYEAGLSE